MKTLATYFLERWWGFYLGVLFINTLITLVPGGESQIAQGCVSLFLVCLFADYLGKGGGGAFWIPLRRKQIGRVYWVFFLLVPTLIFTGAELLGILLSDALSFSVWAVLKHSVFFFGFVSSTFALSKRWPKLISFFFLFLLIGIYWPPFGTPDLSVQMAFVPVFRFRRNDTLAG